MEKEEKKAPNDLTDYRIVKLIDGSTIVGSISLDKDFLRIQNPLQLITTPRMTEFGVKDDNTLAPWVPFSTDKLYVTGDVEWMVDGSITISASKDITIGTDTNIKLVSTGQQQYYSTGDVFLETDGAYNNISANTFINANGPMDIRGTRIDLAKEDPIAPAPEKFAFAGITPPEFATPGGGGSNAPQAVDGSGSLGPQNDGGGPMSAGDLTEPGDCTRKDLGKISEKYESNERYTIW